MIENKKELGSIVLWRGCLVGGQVVGVGQVCSLQEGFYAIDYYLGFIVVDKVACIGAIYQIAI